MPLSVLVADDDRAVRAAVVAALGADPVLSVAGEAADGPEAWRLAQTSQADLVLLDVRMPGSGPALVRRLVSLPSRPVVVALSSQAAASTWLAMLAAGCGGYLLKGALGEDLPVLLRRCAAGELVVGVPGAGDVLRRKLAP